MDIIKKTIEIIKSLIIMAYSAVDLRDCFVFGGLFLLGYGLYLLRPWLGYAIPGAILFCMGYLPGVLKR